MERQTFLSANELDTVKNFILDKAKTCIHKPEGMLKHRFVTPTFSVQAGADDESEVAERSSVGHYLQMYDWDACFFSGAASRLGFDGLVKDVIHNFLSLKQDSGYIPRTVSGQKIWDAGDQCKPFLCQTLLSEFKRTDGNISDLQSLVDQLKHYLEFFDNERKDSSGLYHWRNVLESGIDNNLALLPPKEAAQSETHEAFSYPDGRLVAVDLNSYLVAEFEAYSKLAELCNETEVSNTYSDKANKLKDLIEEKLWSEKSGMYLNYDPKYGEHVNVKAWTGLIPSLFGISDDKRTKRVIEDNILNEKQFFRPKGISSLSCSEQLYNNAKRGLYGRALVCNWQGPVWILSNTFVVRALVKEGYEMEALEISSRAVRNLLVDIKERQLMHESYDAETGEPVWAPQFMSWNIFALELIELLEKKPVLERA